MTSHQFAALALRLFALWLLLTAAQIAVVTWAVARSGQDTSVAAFAVATLYLLAALLLWRFPLLLARTILPGDDSGRPGSVDAGSAAAVAFVSVGLLVIALKALTPLANYVSLISLLLISGQSQRLLTSSLHIDGLTGIAMLAVGLALILKARSLARVVATRG